MHPDGSYTPLRVGKGVVEVSFAGFTTRAEIVVRPY
jgi:hypothetical protein